MDTTERSTGRRIIIALDLDSFYVSSERIRDPSLLGKPIGIQQKAILATCSYEARARGVGKLMSVKEAKKHYLTLYRRHSRLVFRLVRSLVGTQVEKLGMDELFIDVTSLIDLHLFQLEAGSDVRESQDGRRWFQLDSTPDAGFWYIPYTWEGHLILSPTASTSPTPESIVGHSCVPYQLASHLAAYIRSRIFADVGLTSSAGISHNKLLAKLIASVHKPAQQTSIDLTLEDWPLSDEIQARITAFTGAYQLRSLPGFGRSIEKQIQNVLCASTLNRTFPLSSEEDGPPLDPLSLTVSQTIEHLSRAQFRAMYPTQQADSLWDLLYGIDKEPIRPSPDYPAQTSVEDSFALDPRFDWVRVRKETRRLLHSLLVRLEGELMNDDSVQSASLCTSSSSKYSDNVHGPIKFVRFYETLRLSVRRSFGKPIPSGLKNSQSTLMPVFVYDWKLSIGERVDRMLGNADSKSVGGGGVIGALLRGLLGSNPNGEFELYVINVAATSLVVDLPQTLFGFSDSLKASSNGTIQPVKHIAPVAFPPELDLPTLLELPRDIRLDVLHSFGLTEADLTQARRTLDSAERGVKRKLLGHSSDESCVIGSLKKPICLSDSE
ncbi:DNA polymerase iota/DNA damage inducible protein [Phaffia rhodozyma]|uniref:DNA polymerase iota/DNA damage inducible protein n=1 Tax=Phaffia rhodozyma TaxID=264483 RepID=A0A0F7SKL0_PHARH|nr:DNA polymerase iota/DNA damage inducible protein [Phaffia rhodozyma]